MQHALISALIAIGAASLAAISALALTRYLEPIDRSRRRRLENRIAPTTLLFRDDTLIDATQPARALLARLPSPGRAALIGWIEARLPGTAAALERLPAEGQIEIVSGEGHGSARLRVLAEDLGEQMMRLTLTDPSAEGAGIVVDALSQAALEEEAAVLRDSVDHAPMLSWRQTRTGQVVWGNSAYLAEAEELSNAGGPPLWPLPLLFDLPSAEILAADDPIEGAARKPFRARLETTRGPRWFDCHVRPIGSELLLFALPADDAVRAERSLREFVQTLTKTFADLPIGLAIFDSQRQLALFNPALIDLTGLPTSFLTARPALFTFLDRMREGRMVPEPRDYRSWRQQMSTLEAAASSGHHVETWSLPGGQTYRVTGRPHPDGALAFLFEDITSEMSLTRRFRQQLSLGTQVLDAIDDALGVYAPDGQMVMGNDAWRRMWGEVPLTLAERLRGFEAALGSSAGLNRLIDHLSSGKARVAATGAMAGPDNRLLSWRVAPLPAGQTMLSFAINPVQQGALPGPAADPPAAAAPTRTEPAQAAG